MKLMIYCAGGLGKEIFDLAKRLNDSNKKWDDIFFVDDDPSLGNEFYGTKLFTYETLLSRFNPDEFEVSIANGEPVINQLLYNKLRSDNINLATLIDDTAIISHTAKIYDGAIITPYCSVSSNAVVNINASVNTKSIVGHDVVLGAHCVISSLVNIGGASTIGENSYIGMGVSIKEGKKIGKDTIIGMGSVVYDDIPDEVIALGNPARPMRKNIDKKVFKK